MPTRGRHLGLFYVALILTLHPNIMTAWVRASDDIYPPATHVKSLREVSAILQFNRKAMRSIFVRYESDPIKGPDHPNSQQYVSVVLYANADNRYTRWSHFTKWLPEDLDISLQEVRYTPKRLSRYWPLSREYEFYEKLARAEFSQKNRSEMFMESIAWWPPGDQSDCPEKYHDVGKKTAQFFLHTLPLLSEYRLLDHLEPVEGCLCYVLERPGFDKMWLDASVGYGLRRREWYFGSPPQLSAAYILSNYRECEQGLFLPMKVQRILYAFSENSRMPEPRVEQESLLKVLTAEVNVCRDELLQFEPPAGALVENRDTGKVSQIPGGLDVLDDVAVLAQKRKSIFIREGIIPIVSSNMKMSKEVIAAVCVCAFFVLQLCLLVKKLFRRT